MSDREFEPTDLFDAVCRLDDLAEWLAADYPAEAESLRQASSALKGFVTIRLPDDPVSEQAEALPASVKLTRGGLVIEPEEPR